jgi:class 3 adenylate cyclase
MRVVEGSEPNSSTTEGNGLVAVSAACVCQAPSKGVAFFLERFCRQPDALLPAFAATPGRREILNEGEVLCLDEAPADVFWIVEEGQVVIRKDHPIATRQVGEIVGEAAFYRLNASGAPNVVRGATVDSGDRAVLCRFDRSFIDRFDDRQRSVWHETIARVLTAKLDEATVSRDKLKHDRANGDALIRHFVPAEGLSAARAVFDNGKFTRRLDPESCNAVVWFSDIAGFSALTSSVPAEESARLLRRLMDIQAAAIQKFDGEVDKFSGDGLMAFWRAPDEERLATAARQSMSAALNCHRELTAFFKKEQQPTLGIRIGLHAGPVILGDFGGGDRIAFTLIGETVNAAARYEQARTCVAGRELGPIRVSPKVFDLIDDPSVRSLFEKQQRKFADKHDVPFAAFVSK